MLINITMQFTQAQARTHPPPPPPPHTQRVLPIVLHKKQNQYLFVFLHVQTSVEVMENIDKNAQVHNRKH